MNKNDDSQPVNFMGRVMESLLYLTDSSRTVYAPECSAWFIHSAPDQKVSSTTEACGLRTFALLERSIGMSLATAILQWLLYHHQYHYNAHHLYQQH